MTIHLTKKHDEEAWDRYVGQADRSTCCHQIGWKKVIEDSFGHATWYLHSKNGTGDVNGILPMVQMKSALFGNFMVSLPFLNYGGLCADDHDAENGLLQEAVRIAGTVHAKHIEFRHTVPDACGLQVKTAKVSMRLDLPKLSDDLWKSFPSKLRSQVQRPLREGMYARLGREGELDDFYAVFSANMRDLGTPVYSKEFFRNILRTFPSTSWICTICTKERVSVASAFLVGFKDMLEIPWASSLRSYNLYSPNMLLYWSVLRIACEKGYSIFDFGRSTPGEGTYKFKEQWGARPVPLYWHYWMKNGGALPELNPKNPKYQMAIRIWKKMPLGLTKLIGPSIVKNLP